MRIIVYTKPVPADMDTFSPELSPDSGILFYHNVENFMINPYDELAVEEALRIKEKLGNTEVTVIGLGPLQALKTFEACMAMGVDRGIFLEDNEYHVDSYHIASILDKAINYFNLGYDLILCGKKTIDDDKAQVGTYLAEILHLTLVRDVVKVELSLAKDRMGILNRKLPQGNQEVVKCALPALFTIDMGINIPRYPTFTSRLAAKKKIHRIKTATLKSGSEHQILKAIHFSEPKLRASRLGPDPSLSPQERVKWMLSGGVSEKKGKRVSGNPENSASKIIEFLIENKIISPRKQQKI